MNDNLVYKLQNGDIFKFHGMLLEHFDDKYYGVVDTGHPLLVKKYKRTGIKFTRYEINLINSKLINWKGLA